MYIVHVLAGQCWPCSHYNAVFLYTLLYSYVCNFAWKISVSSAIFQNGEFKKKSLPFLKFVKIHEF